MFTAWKIEGIDGYKFDKDGNLYRLPFVSGKKSYGLRKIKMQYPNRWLIRGQMWSKEQLRNKLVKDDNPTLIDTDLPF